MHLQLFTVDAVYLIDWPNVPYTSGSFCAYSPANEPFFGTEKINGVPINKLFKPTDVLYFAGEAAGITTPPGTLGAAFESAEHVSRIIKQRLLWSHYIGARFGLAEKMK